MGTSAVINVPLSSPLHAVARDNHRDCCAGAACITCAALPCKKEGRRGWKKYLKKQQGCGDAFRWSSACPINAGAYVHRASSHTAVLRFSTSVDIVFSLQILLSRTMYQYRCARGKARAALLFLRTCAIVAGLQLNRIIVRTAKHRA